MSQNIKNLFSSFENKAAKYHLIEANYRQVNTLPDCRFDLSSSIPCCLPEYIQDMLLELVSTF